MTILEELLLKLRAIGGVQAAAEVDTITGSVSKSGTAAEAASVKHAKLGSSLGGMASMAKNAAGMVGIAGLAFGIDKAVKNAQAFQDTQAQLASSIKANVHEPARGAAEQMATSPTRMATHGGFLPVQAMQGMTQFLRVTKDVAKSEGDMTLATNIARGAHVDLGPRCPRRDDAGARPHDRAVQARDHHHAGQDRPGRARRVDDRTRPSSRRSTPSNWTRSRPSRPGWPGSPGSTAARWRPTAGPRPGGTTNLANSMEVLAEKVGQMLLPVISTAVGFLQKMVGPLEGLLSVLRPVVPLIIGLGLAWLAYKAIAIPAAAITAVMEAELWGNVAAAIALIPTIGGLADAWDLLDMAMNDNAIGLVVLAIGALVVGLIYAYNHVTWFRNAVNDAWSWIKTATVDAFGAVKGAIVDVWDWVKSHWYATLFLGPFGR